MKVPAQIENYTFCCLIAAASISSISTLWPEPMTSRWPGSVSSRGPGHQPQTAREESSSSAGLAGIIIAAGLEGHFPHSKVHGANMGPIWGRQDPGGPHVGSMNPPGYEPCYLGWLNRLISEFVFIFLFVNRDNWDWSLEGAFCLCDTVTVSVRSGVFRHNRDSVGTRGLYRHNKTSLLA